MDDSESIGLSNPSPCVPIHSGLIRALADHRCDLNGVGRIPHSVPEGCRVLPKPHAVLGAQRHPITLAVYRDNGGRCIFDAPNCSEKFQLVCLWCKAAFSPGRTRVWSAAV